jgi:hypothetical protein
MKERPPPKRRGAGKGAPQTDDTKSYRLRYGPVKRLLAALEPFAMRVAWMCAQAKAEIQDTQALAEWNRRLVTLNKAGGS